MRAAGAGGGIAVDVADIVAMRPGTHLVDLHAAAAPLRHDGPGECGGPVDPRALEVADDVAQAEQGLDVDGGAGALADHSGATRSRMRPTTLRGVSPSADARHVRPRRCARISCASACTSCGVP